MVRTCSTSSSFHQADLRTQHDTAPVHSFAAALFLPKDRIHNFYDM